MAKKKFSRTQQRQLDILRDTINSQLPRVQSGETVNIPLPEKWSTKVVERLKKNLARHDIDSAVRYDDSRPLLSITKKAA